VQSYNKLLFKGRNTNIDFA